MSKAHTDIMNRQKKKNRLLTKQRAATRQSTEFDNYQHKAIYSQSGEWASPKGKRIRMSSTGWRKKYGWATTTLSR